MNELVFIGQEMNKDKIIGDLDTCLITPDETLEYVKKTKFFDPFPADI
jgi:hypothetical protein